MEGGLSESWLVARVGEGLAGSTSLGVGDVLQFTSPLGRYEPPGFSHEAVTKYQNNPKILGRLISQINRLISS